MKNNTKETKSDVVANIEVAEQEKQCSAKAVSERTPTLSECVKRSPWLVERQWAKGRCQR